VFVKEDRKTGKVVQKPCSFIAKFHYTSPTGPDQTKSADFVVNPGLHAARVSRKSPCGSVRVCAGPVGSGRTV